MGCLKFMLILILCTTGNWYERLVGDAPQTYTMTDLKTHA